MRCYKGQLHYALDNNELNCNAFVFHAVTASHQKKLLASLAADNNPPASLIFQMDPFKLRGTGDGANAAGHEGHDVAN